jgi:hypothetical protein
MREVVLIKLECEPVELFLVSFHSLSDISLSLGSLQTKFSFELHLLNLFMAVTETTFTLIFLLSLSLNHLEKLLILG